MVLEKIISVEKVESNFFYGILFGALISVIGIVIGANIFTSNPSMAALFFIVIGSVPFFRKMLFLEEAQMERDTFGQLLNDYRKIITVFLSFYIGVALTYFLLTIFPVPFIGSPEVLFESQLRVFSGFSGNFLNPDAFLLILANNWGVVALTLILSLLYGAGSVLVLSWNASTLGVFFATIGASAFTYIPHASLEFFGFFSAAVAGGLISAAIEKHEFGTPGFARILKDVAFLTLIAIILITIGAFIEASLF